jgi:poly(A) polymerase
VNDHNSSIPLARIREATAGTEYENRLWLVGGWVRDKVLGLPPKQDIDIVLEGDALSLAWTLHESGITSHAPVTYPRFGTAMVAIEGQNVELVTARRESYNPDSRKPSVVERSTIAEDALRRDFTINTLIENVHTGKIEDPLGKAYSDIEAKLIRTPLEPEETFHDDPLRMLRAVRFSARLGFDIEPETWRAIVDNAARLYPPTVSAERIRDEFVKIVAVPRPSRGLNQLRESGLLAAFAPELLEMWGCTQNEFHSMPVWEHVLQAVDNLADYAPNGSQNLKLSVLFHDIGKPRTRSVGEDGRVHFYGHEDIGATMTRDLMTRLKFPNSDIDKVFTLVAQHMRIGEYKDDQWTDAAVRRFIRAADGNVEDLFNVHSADVSALSSDHRDMTRAKLLRERIQRLESSQPSREIISPLSGNEIMELIGSTGGPIIGEIKDWLTNEVLEGRLTPRDKVGAAAMVVDRWNGATPINGSGTP